MMKKLPEAPPPRLKRRRTLRAFIIILAAVTAALNMTLAAGEAASEMSGLFLIASNNTDYPSAPAMLKREMEKEAERIVDFAVSSGITSIFYEVRPMGGAMYKSAIFPSSALYTGSEGMVVAADPLRILTDAAKEKNLDVYAVVNPYYDGPADIEPHYRNPAYQNPDWLIYAPANSIRDGSRYYDPSNPSVTKLIVDGVVELVVNYELAGIVIDEIDNEWLSSIQGYYHNVRYMLESVYNAATHYSPGIKLGIITETSAQVGDRSSMLSGLSRGGYLDFIVPKIDASIDSGHVPNAGGLNELQSLRSDFDVKIWPLNESYPARNPNGDSTLPDSESTMLVINDITDFDGNVYAGYMDLSFRNPIRMQLNLSSLYSVSATPSQPGQNTDPSEPPSQSSQAPAQSSQAPDPPAQSSQAPEPPAQSSQAPEPPTQSSQAVSGQPTTPQHDNIFTDVGGVSLVIPKAFAITEPARNISTNYSTYYIRGTSNPDLPLYYNGSELARTTTGGTWGVFVNLSVGDNVFEFSQGGQIHTVKITRTPASAVSKITTIVASSAYPSSDDAVFGDNTVTLSCTAPSGGQVTAVVNGYTVELQQVAVADAGVPATFRLEVNFGDFNQNEITNIGNITYYLDYNGNRTSRTSTGSLYVVGSAARLVVEVTEYIGNVYVSASSSSSLLSFAKKGGVDYVSGQTGSYFELASGGYISKSNVKILANQSSAANTASNASLSKNDGSEDFIITGSRRPLYQASMTSDRLTVTLYNTSGVPDLDSLGSDMLSSIEVTQQGAHTRIVFNARQGVSIWGYDVSYDGTSTVIRVKKAPSLSSDPTKPLSGIVIVLDPGHGGDDPGALGVAGENGPIEKDLNLAVSLITRAKLQSLGATVYMTRSADTRIIIDDRVEVAYRRDADFFISFHHNSVGHNSNGGNARGTEVYYFTSGSRAFAEQLCRNITSAAGYVNRGAKNDTYRMTRMYFCPSVLVELGFLPNPAEYEALCDITNMNRVANGVADTITAYLR